MKKKRNRKKKRIWWYLCSGLLGIVLLVYLLLQDQYLSGEMLMKDLGNLFSYPFWNRKKEDQTESYLIQKKVNAALLEEISNLKELLKLDQTMTDFEVINATLLNRKIDYWLQTLSVDRGKKDGVEIDDIVVTEKGMIGRVKRVTNATSEIELLSAQDESFQVSVELDYHGEAIYGVLQGYDEKEGYLLVKGISSQSEVTEGVDVVTSGLTGNHPRGIYIGTVHHVENRSSYEKVLYVKPKQDFNQIQYVSILRRKES